MSWWPEARCGCSEFCGDDGDVDGPGVCKALPVRPEPLVEVVLVPRRPVERAVPDEAT